MVIPRAARGFRLKEFPKRQIKFSNQFFVGIKEGGTKHDSGDRCVIQMSVILHVLYTPNPRICHRVPKALLLMPQFFCEMGRPENQQMRRLGYW